ncbi:MAG: hypothetical protein ACYSUI_08560 [Planctomycetota bacterium]|jgi:hypothetical protein
MNDQALKALQVETEFLAGVESNFEQAKGRQLRGTIWQTARHDDEAALRAALASHRRHDRAVLKQLPRNRRIAVHGFERRWWFGKRRTGVAIASILAPLEHFAAGSEGKIPPVDLGELVDHVRKLATDPKLPHVIGVCSPGGFTAEALNSQLELPNVTLVLIEPREGGGWRVTGVNENLSEQELAMFDPEAASQKLERVRREIQQRGADLLVGGLNASSMAGRLDLPEAVVAQAFEQAAMAEPELKVTRKSGEVLLFRGAPAATQEKAPMSMIDRIRALFDREGDEAAKINLLAERRAGLAQRRDRIYEDITKLEDKEAKLLEQGRTTSSAVSRRRLASQLAQLRKDIARQNTTANMLNSQINIISTDIHNLTLIQQGQMAKLPDTEELTQNAVQAEEMLESLKADADMVASLETGMGETMTSDEELAILKEFEGPATIEAPTRASARPEAPPVEEKEEAREEPEKSRRPTADPES